MPAHRRLPQAPAVALWRRLRAELDVAEEFPAEVLAAAEEAAASPRLPSLDRTDLPLRTIDPPASRDLDQAVAFERTTSGFRVRYAIADVAAFVRPGSPLDHEAHRRGATLYAPDRRVPLHPPVLSEGAASLLPGEVRPALLWTHELGHDGASVGAVVERALVRSTRRFAYAEVDALLESGRADEQLVLLREVGELRRACARERGAVELPSLEQEVDIEGDGRPVLRYRRPSASEAWNAEISLLTGMAAASLMLDAGVGILRTLAAPDDGAVAELERSAAALGVSWRAGEPYADVIGRLDPAVPGDAALLALAPRLLRGAAYVAFDGEPPAAPVHSAVAAPYAHCTAPLRRLVDRYALEVCVAACAGTRPPSWVTDALAALPDEMAAADRRAHELERATVDLAEAIVLQPCVGREMTGIVVSTDGERGVVQLTDPAVRATVRGDRLRAGAHATVRLVEADPDQRRVSFVAV